MKGVQLMDLSGRTALVTAAAGAGIGSAVASRLASEGVHVVVTDVHERRIEETVEALREEYDARITGRVMDVTNSGQVNEVVAGLIGEFGKVDMLVNNAGFNKTEPIWEMELETWERILDVCLTGMFRVTRAIIPHMIDRERGAIVNLSSVAGWTGGEETGQSHYAAAKAGVMGFTRAVAREAAPYNVRVNAVAPGLIPNPFLNRIYEEEYLNELQEKTPLPRTGQPEDVANTVAYLVSDQSSFITGEVVCVSGGLYLAP